jgi:hypothetical protein
MTPALRNKTPALRNKTSALRNKTVIDNCAIIAIRILIHSPPTHPKKMNVVYHEGNAL